LCTDTGIVLCVNTAACEQFKVPSNATNISEVISNGNAVWDLLCDIGSVSAPSVAGVGCQWQVSERPDHLYVLTGKRIEATKVRSRLKQRSSSCRTSKQVPARRTLSCGALDTTRTPQLRVLSSHRSEGGTDLSSSSLVSCFVARRRAVNIMPLL